MAAKIAVAPFSMPAMADDTRCSANGNMLSGKASQMMLSAAIGQKSPGASGRRAAGHDREGEEADDQPHEGHAEGRHGVEPLGDEQERSPPDRAGHDE